MAKSILLIDRIPHAFINGVTRYMQELVNSSIPDKYNIQLRVLFWGLELSPALWLPWSRFYNSGFYNHIPKPLIGFNQKYLFKIAQQKTQADLLHFPVHSVPEGWLASSQPRLLSVHGAASQVAPEWDTQQGRDVKLKRIMEQAKQHKVWFMTVSEFARQQIIEHYDLPPERITVIYHGVDTQTFYPLPDEAVQVFCYKHKLTRPYLLYLGPCAPRKNIIRIVQAFARVKKMEHLPHQLVIAGRYHPHQKIVEAQIQKLNIEDSVRFWGVVDAQDLPYLYNGADAFVFISLYEGFGMPVIEAMACGTPVITSGMTATGEIAGDSAAIVDDPTQLELIIEIMTRILTNTDYQDSLRKKGLARAKMFSWAETAEKHFQLYQHIIEHG